jgi:hypothetical protein
LENKQQLRRLDSPRERQEVLISILSTLADHLETRFSDGRALVGGDQIAHADF